MSHSPLQPSRTRSKRRLWFIIIAALISVVLLISAPVGYIKYRNHQLDLELQGILKSLDESDPDWRFDDMLGSRRPMPPEENAALQVIAATRMMPRGWGSRLYAPPNDIRDLRPPIQLNAQQIVVLREELGKAKAALAVARTLRKYKKGQYKLHWTEDVISTLLPDIQNAREVAMLLEHDVQLLAQQKKCEQAWQSCESIYRTASSLDNLDCLIILLVRIAIRSISANAMERVLAQGELNADSLKATQKMIAGELDEPILWRTMRAERGGMHKTFGALQSGKLDLTMLQGLTTGGRGSRFFPKKGTPLYGPFIFVTSGMNKSGHIWSLKYMDKSVKAAKLPLSERLKRFHKLDDEVKKAKANGSLPIVAGMLVPAIAKVASADVREHVRMRCVIAGLACERFRLKHNRWPTSFEELVKQKLIAKSPIDPYDGKPLRYKQSQNGVVIYSIGDGVFRGYKGQLLDDPEYEGPPTYRLAFHVWNPGKRRQKARPPQLRGLFQTDVWQRKKGGYHTYRIPSLIVTNKGTLLAFCEGRKDNSRDHGDIDLIVKRSTDKGFTWSEHKIVYEEGGAQKITIGNPCPVVDRQTGIIWMPFTRDNTDVLMTHSKDDGQTWAKPVDITSSVKKKNWGWYATGPGVGIQMEKGKYKGRLVIPCDHRFGKPKVRTVPTMSHVFWSDDHGKTWKLGAAVAKHTNECQVVELPNGDLMINMRNYWGRDGKDKSRDRMRAVAVSKDGGATWGAVTFDKSLIEPICQASLIRCNWPKDGSPGEILFSNPARKTSRFNLTVRMSENDGKTWHNSKSLNTGPSAYSCLAKLPDGSVGCLYECGDDGPYEKIRFARFKLNWLIQP